MTRHTAEPGMCYAREEVESYRSLVGLVLHTQSKEFVGIVDQSQERAAVRGMSFKAMMREVEPIAKGEVAGYSLEERKAAFGLLNELSRLTPSTQLNVRENWHQELQEPKHIQS